MYMLLIGSPPFNGRSNEEIMTNVKNGSVSYTGSQWKEISNEGLCLVRKMLTQNPRARISAEKALNDPWFLVYSTKTNPNKTEVLTCIKKLRSFQAISAMKKAVLSYMAAHILSKQEEGELRDVFKMLDKDNNGLLSLDEITEGYKMLFDEDHAMARKEAIETIKNIDINNNGTIDYNGKSNLIIEFLMANLKRSCYMNEANLKMVFDFFDENHDGSISISELQRVFSGIEEEALFDNVVDLADTNKDGLVLF